MRQIPLTRGLFAIVDDIDFVYLSKWKWQAKWNRYTKTFYAYRSEYVGPPDKKRMIGMHQAIMRPKKGRIVDHRNHVTLDNRRQNLRTCTKAQNSWNQGIRKNNKSGLKGVYWCQNRWRVCIGVNRRNIYLGVFRTLEEAAKAYADGARRYHGQFAGETQ